MSYIVKGFIADSTRINKSFSSLANANHYLDKVLENYGCQVEDSFTDKDGTFEYVCSDYTRFYVSSEAKN